MPLAFDHTSCAANTTDSLSVTVLDILVALFKIARESSREENRVDPELCVQQWHVAVYLCELVYAEVTFREVFVISREIVRAAGASECPSGGNLQGRRGERKKYTSRHIKVEKPVFTHLFSH